MRRHSQDTKSMQFKERTKEKKSTFFMRNNPVDFHEEIEKNSVQTSDSDNISCPDPQGLKNYSDCMSDISLNDSYTSYSSEKSTNFGPSSEIFVLPVVRKSRFCTKKEENKIESKEDINNSDEENKFHIDIEREENLHSTLSMRRNKTDPPNISTNLHPRLTVPNNFLDEQTAQVFKNLAKLKARMEKTKTAIETYKFIGTTAKTLLNQVPYVKGT